MTFAWRIRALLLTMAAAAAVHQSRYLIAPPDHVHQGVHAYLSWAIPIVAIAVVVGAAELFLRLRRGVDGSALRLPPLPILVVGFAFTLLTLFAAQETIEFTLEHRALPQQAPIVAEGAWVAIPLSLALGATLALLLGGAALIEARALLRSLSPRRLRRDRPRPPLRVFAGVAAAISLSLAPRGPPRPA